MAASADFPRKINLGSGKDFKADYFNIDINPYWTPDAVFDVSEPMADKLTLKTKRFGKVRLTHALFDEIICNDVLEHVPDLIRTMTNCLNLLRIGGKFHINVPYDLSYGAWQDPTHIRAFNERSWLYYTDWFWYLGWRTHRFTLTRLDFVASELGREMQAGGPLTDVIIRTPRAIDSMNVTLEKIALSEQDKLTLQHYRP